MDVPKSDGWNGLNMPTLLRRAVRDFQIRLSWIILLLLMKKMHAGKRLPRGLLMIQVDGLARPQLEKALHHGKMPFLRRILAHEDYLLHSMYSGLPSSTPAVQGELFYGAVCAVPSFGFLDRKSGFETSMFSRKTATGVESRISVSGDPLLKEGSSYGNVFTGGAKYHRFCLSDRGREESDRSGFFPYLLHSPYGYLLYACSFVRAAALSLIEIGIAVFDFLRGIVSRQNFVKELSFIPARILICIVLREFIKAHVMNDLARGVPVIHANLIGYDEQSHRRGPSSAFAHWTLQGIDAAIGAMWHKARASRKREYDVWIYSDHGQEETVCYSSLHKGGIAEAISRAAEKAGCSAPLRHSVFQGIMRKRAALLYPERPPVDLDIHAETDGPRIHLAGMGPLMHVYLGRDDDETLYGKIAESLTNDNEVPMVIRKGEQGTATVWNRDGKWRLPGEAASVVGGVHPFLDEIGEDLVRLAHHENAGDLILSGWHSGEQAISFPVESGAHAGPGYCETHGFCCAPAVISFARSGEKAFLRPSVLRTAALRFLERLPQEPAIRKKRPASPRLRVMSYNTHSCIGIDGTVSPQRVAQVIARYEPDIVALQELDFNRERTGFSDQAMTIADILDMKFHYHPAHLREDGSFGNAVLTRFPITKVRTILLPGYFDTEPRSGLQVIVDFGYGEMTVIATHLSFYPSERHMQCRYLLESEGVGLIDPCILCGDFNMTPRSESYRLMTGVFRDSYSQVITGRTNRSWMGLSCLDYLFVTSRVRVHQVTVPRDEFTRRVSDHAPVIAEVEIE